MVGQGRAALAAQGERSHHLLVRFLIPRLQAETPARPLFGLLILAMPLILISQALQSTEYQPVDLLSLAQNPFRKVGAVRESEAIQKAATVQRR